MTSGRLRVEVSAQASALVDRLVALALRGLPLMYRSDREEFAFTRAADTGGSNGDGAASIRASSAELRGSSTRYAAIVALGSQFLDADDQRRILGGRTTGEFVELLVKRLPQTRNLGDVALVCWAAAEANQSVLPPALTRLREIDDGDRPQYVVEAAWVLAALTAMRKLVDVEAALERARRRLLASQVPGSPLFPHATGAGLLPWYRSHISCYADQVYPIQALARLHASGDDPAALRAADRCAQWICRLQGASGQWWWHYDARNGDLVEGYPVYSVHQHAMGPMALLDLADAGGEDFRPAIELGLTWLTKPTELGGEGESLIRDSEGLTWRKVYRGDPRKVVRAANGLSTRAIRGMRLPGVDRVYPPTSIDRECRPYEFGWLLYAWLPRRSR